MFDYWVDSWRYQGRIQEKNRMKLSKFWVVCVGGGGRYTVIKGRIQKKLMISYLSPFLEKWCEKYKNFITSVSNSSLFHLIKTYWQRNAIWNVWKIF